MKPVSSTAEILMLKVLKKPDNKAWVKWAYEMMLAGFETEHLVILAGMEEPFDFFEMQNLTDKVLGELDLDYANIELVTKDYVAYVSIQALEGKLNVGNAFYTLKSLYQELNHFQPLTECYLLYHAWEELQTGNDQWYLDKVDQSNLDQVIEYYFRKWAGQGVGKIPPMTILNPERKSEVARLVESNQDGKAWGFWSTGLGNAIKALAALSMIAAGYYCVGYGFSTPGIWNSFYFLGGLALLGGGAALFIYVAIYAKD